MVVTDLDGTLLRADHSVGAEDMDALIKLGGQGVVRVAATGRSIYTAAQVLSSDFPIDYLVFSTGSGVMRWADKQLTLVMQLQPEEVTHIASLLVMEGFDFMVHEAIPKNHLFQFYTSGDENADFNRRCEHYRNFGSPFIPGIPFPEPCTQILIILSPEKANREEEVRRLLPEYSIIKATSPFDGRSLWLEVFPQGVSKAHGIDWVAATHSIAASDIVAVGNDYNDVEMLNHAGCSFVVANAPGDLRAIYHATTSNEQSGFSHAVRLAMEGMIR